MTVPRPTVQLSNGYTYRLAADHAGYECTSPAFEGAWVPLMVPWTLEDVRLLASLQPPSPLQVIVGPIPRIAS